MRASSVRKLNGVLQIGLLLYLIHTCPASRAGDGDAPAAVGAVTGDVSIAGAVGEPLPQRRYRLLGADLPGCPCPTLSLYRNMDPCDPNDVAFTTFDELLDSSLVQNCAANGNRTGCSGVCPTSGPVYFQDSGTSIPADATCFDFAYGSDEGYWIPVPEDADQDGDVDLADFTLFQLCFGGANNPPAGTCAPQFYGDFDGDSDVDLADFLIFQRCFGGSGNPPAPSCPHQPEPGGAFGLDVCFWAGTDTASPGAVGVPIVRYTLLSVPADNRPHDGEIALITVQVDLQTTPPHWTAERPVDSMVFSGTLLKNGFALLNPDTVPLPGGRFGVSIGEPTGTVKDAGLVRAHGGNGQQNGLRLLDAAPECAVACGEVFSPDLIFHFVDPNSGNCTFDNCAACGVENAGIYFGIGALGPAPPDDVIDRCLPAAITDAGCYDTVAAIDDPLDVDMRRVRVNSVPAEGLQLAAYSAGEAGGNPLLRVFKEDGTELANNDSDGRDFLSVEGCAPLPGTAALVSVTVSEPGNYYVAVSGGGCDAYLPAPDCSPDPAATCNDGYDPMVSRSGTPGQDGLYNLTIGLGSLAPVGDEPNDSLGTAIAATNTGTAGAFLAIEQGYMGDGPFGECLGDFDYWLVPGSELTPGNALDVEVISDYLGHDTSSGMMVWEKIGSQPHTLVAVNDNTLGSRDSRCLVPINAGADYYVLVMPVGFRPQTIDTFHRYGVPGDFPPGLDQLVPGAGDGIPGALSFGPGWVGEYDLRITEIPLPPETGPFEPNDTLAQADANATWVIVPNQLPQSIDAVLGDGRYGWSLPSGGALGDVDLYRLEGLEAGGVVEVAAIPHPTHTTSLFVAFFASERLHRFTDRRLTGGPTGGISASLLATVPQDGPYYAYVTGDDDRSLGWIGNFLPWDVTIPGTLLNGQFSGPYRLSVTAASPPPPARPGSRMCGASRGAAYNNNILELNPDTGDIVNVLPAPAVVNGAATGLAINNTGTVLYYQNGPGIGGTGNIMWELDPDTGAVLHSTNLTLDPFINQTSGGTVNIDGSLDGIDWAGGHIWMCLQNVARVYRWNPATRQANHTFTAGSMGLTSFRDGLGGTDESNLGSGHIIYVAARNTRQIAVIDVGPNGRGPAGNDVMVLVCTLLDPTYSGGPGISNNGGMAVLPSATGMPPTLLHVAHINDRWVWIAGGDCAAGVLGAWIYPDFGPSGLTGWAPPAE